MIPYLCKGHVCFEMGSYFGEVPVPKIDSTKKMTKICDLAKKWAKNENRPQQTLFNLNHTIMSNIKYEKNLAMQDTTNLEPGGGMWEVLACN